MLGSSDVVSKDPMDLGGSNGNALGGHSSGEDDNDEREGGIRVGRDYQATTPAFIPESRECQRRTIRLRTMFHVLPLR